MMGKIEIKHNRNLGEPAQKLLPLEFFSTVAWCRGAMVKSAHYHRGCEFESYTCHNENAISKAGSLKPPHKIHFRREELSVVSLVSAPLEIEHTTPLLLGRKVNYCSD